MLNCANMTQETDSSLRLPAFFDNHPEIKAKLVEYLKTVSPEEKKKNIDDFMKFTAGEMSWGEIRGITKRMQKHLARYSYLKYKMKDYVQAEKLFKGLAIIDHTNWYYRAALGAVYQKMRRFEDAVNEYDMAIDIKDDEWSNYVNRGECLMSMRDFAAAREDFQHVVRQGLPQNNPWHLRALILLQKAKVAEEQDQHVK